MWEKFESKDGTCAATRKRSALNAQWTALFADDTDGRCARKIGKLFRVCWKTGQLSRVWATVGQVLSNVGKESFPTSME